MRKDLNGTWTLTCDATGERIPASVPGDITADFFAANKIADPYFGMHYKDERYILEGDYTYSYRFSARKPQAGERAVLKFSGIDTFASVYCNDRFLGDTENMFIGYEYDVSDCIAEQNEIRVHMRSTLKRMEGIDAENYFACFNKERIFIRKAQCHFGWDWAPDLPAYGIYGDVTLDYRPQEGIEDVTFRTDTAGNVTFFTRLDYSVRREQFARYKSDRLRYTVERTPDGGLDDGITEEASVNGVKNFRSLRIPNPKLWMPVGYGKPHLYAYKVELIRDGKVVDERRGKLGLREVQLRQTPTAADRMGFGLSINGVDVFVKGSNWVPCECFTGTATEARYERLVRMAADAGINLLRVWGGGMYEKDVFYRLCDEYGVAVWQDFMFACADIPEGDPAFVKNVSRECAYQVKRLRNHPSIVYWCGGNEKTGSCGLMKQYGDDLVDMTLRGIVEHYDGTRPYVRQSPYSFTDEGNDPESGETHGSAFEVTEQNSYLEFVRASFRREASFIGECAVMGSCVPESYRDFIPDDKLWPPSDVLVDRFCENPYGPKMSFTDRQLKGVELFFGKAENLDDFAVKSMAVQAEALKSEILNARRKRDRCGGFLNWMYDDIWPTGTWSVIDYYLRPKAAYYTLKREYAPVRAAILGDGNGKFYGWLLNDTPRKVRLALTVGGVFADGRYADCRECAVTADALCATYLGELNVAGDVLFIEYAASGIAGVATAVTKVFKEIPFVSDYAVQIGTCKKTRDGYRIPVHIAAKAYARSVRIVLPDGVLADDNWFDVLPDKSVTVYVRAERPIGKEEIRVTDFVSETSGE